MNRDHRDIVIDDFAVREFELLERIAVLEHELDISKTFTQVAMTRIHDLQDEVHRANRQKQSLCEEIRRYTQSAGSGRTVA
jgi:hypothetical protein